jgi:hypothetical protein
MALLRKIGKVGASIVFVGYLVVAALLLPYYNWQYAKDNGFVAWFLFGEILPTIKSLAWPYFMFFAGGPTQRRAAPDMNASELERYSRVLGTLHSRDLTPADLDELRGVIREYTTRTGQYLSPEEMRLFRGGMKLSADYQYELAQSMLFSWDQRSYTTTQAFDKLAKQVVGLRKAEVLADDLDAIRAAATHRTYANDADGTRHSFGRETIVDSIRQAEVYKRNAQTLEAVIQEFVRQ